MSFKQVLQIENNCQNCQQCQKSKVFVELCLNSKGLSLIELLIACLVLSLSMTFFIQLFFAALQTSRSAQVTIAMLSVRDNLISNLLNDQSWKNTVFALGANQTSIGCLNNGRSNPPPYDPLINPAPTYPTDPTLLPPLCDPSIVGPPAGPLPASFQIFNSRNELYYDPTLPTNGFRINLQAAPAGGGGGGGGGVPVNIFQTCDTFDSVVGNDNCPFRFDITVLPIDCRGAPPCDPTLVKISGRLILNPKSKNMLPNLNMYHFELYRFALKF